MKKTLSLLAAAAIFAGSAACSSSKKSSSGGDTVVAPEGKTELKVYAMTTYHRNVNDPIAKAANDAGYFLNEKEFWYNDGDASMSKALEEVNLEILSGNAPDVIVAPDHVLEKLRKKGYLADLTPIMERGEGVKPDDLLDNVRESVTRDGEINYIYPYYTYSTAVGKASRFGKDTTGWTYKEAIDALQNLPEGTAWGYECGSVKGLYDYMLQLVALESIDFDDCSCDFSGPFKETLEAIQNVSQDDVSGDYYADDALIKDKYVFFWTRKGFLNGEDIAPLYMLEGEDAAYIGLPSISGNGGYGEPTWACYAIMDTSDRKDEAWKVYSAEFSPEMQNDPGQTFGTPVLASAITARVSDKYKWSLGSIAAYKNPSHFDPEKEWRPSEEQIKQLADYVTSIKIWTGIDPRVTQIINDEYLAVMNGEESVDACVDMLNDRVGIYLSENE